MHVLWAKRGQHCGQCFLVDRSTGIAYLQTAYVLQYNMKPITVKFSYLPLLLLLLLLLLWCDRCESLTDSSVPSIFFPFGRDEGDTVVPVGDNNCVGPVNIPYRIFNHTSIYVSSTSAKQIISIFTFGLTLCRYVVKVKLCVVVFISSLVATSVNMFT